MPIEAPPSLRHLRSCATFTSMTRFQRTFQRLRVRSSGVHPASLIRRRARANDKGVE